MAEERIRGQPRFSPKQRFLALSAVFGGVIAFLGLYLFSMQILRGREYTQQAKTVSQRSAPIPAQRGEIYDRNRDIPLVLNVDSFAVNVIPAEVGRENLGPLFEKLAGLLSVPVSEIESRVPEKSHGLFQEVEVRSGVPFDIVARLAENLEGFRGVTWNNKPIRNYPQSGSIAHIIGYIGDINSEELQVLFNKGYQPRTSVGKSGIEKQYDNLLRGTDGTRFRVVDVKEKSTGSIGPEPEYIPPVAGKNVVLTIDRRIQTICEKALGERVGSVVVLKPGTGEILAMVSYPWFDPNLFTTPEGSAQFAKLTLDPSSPFLNRAIQSDYPPASTFKVVMTTAALAEQPLPSFPVTRQVLCTGKLDYGDRTFNCWVHTGHGRLDLFEALAQSCDVYFYTLGDVLGVDRIVRYARDFGFGSITGIDIPNETSGTVPSRDWKEKTKHARWQGGDTINMSIGQGDLEVTPLQEADMVAMVVNEGVIYKPHLLKEVRDPATGDVETVEPEILHRSPVPKEVFRDVQRAMRRVITEGTAKVVITTDAVEAAGKTGTGEMGFKERWHSWFSAYAPYQTDRPEDRIVVVVSVEAVNQWEWWAPTATDLILQAIFADQTYEEAIKTVRPWFGDSTGRVE
jgi:penicillin-binding protein 2